MAEQKYPHLFSPLTVRGKTFKNRILLAPMGVRETGEPGVMSQTTIDYYERIARGGAARILSAENDVEYGSAVSGHYWYFVDDPPAALLENTRKYAEMCHKYGALAFIHFGYMGAYGRSEETMKGRCLPGMDPEQSRKVLEAARPHHADGSPYLMPQVGGPSDMVIHEPWDGVTSGKLNMDSSDGKVVHALTRQRMEEIADAFAHCAAVVKSCGCDGMVIHSGHGFIFGQWVSRRFNKRTDEFGGSAENRARFPLMCLQRIRDAVGEDFLVEMRFSAQEALEPITDKRFVEDAVDLEDSVAFFRELDKHPGLLDIAHISGGLHTQPVYNTRVTANSLFPMGLNVESAAAIKAAVKNIRVGVVGSMSDPQLCEDVIASGKADFVILCRQLLFADPDFPVKAEAGRDFAIDNCLRCTICRGNDTAR